MALIYRKNDVEQIVSKLKSGQVIAFPTDTVFGLGCMTGNLAAHNRIKEIKNREAHKPLPIMCSNIKMVKEIAEVNADDEHLIKTVGPGAITYILKKKPSLEAVFTNNQDTVAIRIPDDDFILTMINQLGCPMFVTSCNYSNTPSLKYFKDVKAQFEDLVDMIVEDDALSEISSTIYDCINHKILRSGVISIEKINKIIKNK